MNLLVGSPSWLTDGYCGQSSPTIADINEHFRENTSVALRSYKVANRDTEFFAGETLFREPVQIAHRHQPLKIFRLTDSFNPLFY